ncbi:MAG: hypothetical protein QOH43_1065 [Solirubrobacteraceae bacterium]|nr:hypothetical protein [Solirubrobacteraceae bacterium]
MRCFVEITGRSRCFEPVLFEHVYRRDGVDRRMVFCAEHSARFAAGAVSVEPVPHAPSHHRRSTGGGSASRDGYGWQPGCTCGWFPGEDTSRRRCDDLFAQHAAAASRLAAVARLSQDRRLPRLDDAFVQDTGRGGTPPTSPPPPRRRRRRLDVRA